MGTLVGGHQLGVVGDAVIAQPRRRPQPAAVAVGFGKTRELGRVEGLHDVGRDRLFAGAGAFDHVRDHIVGAHLGGGLLHDGLGIGAPGG